MAQYGPILLIDDDDNDADAIRTAVNELNIINGLIHFSKAGEAYEYLLTTKDKPLILLCDVRMPQTDGLTLLRNICNNGFLRAKAIPFIFLTAVGHQEVINEAFKIGIQGFYVKPNNYTRLKDIIRTIVNYWLLSRHPDTTGEEKQSASS